MTFVEKLTKVGHLTIYLNINIQEDDFTKQNILV
jgi:hypothetical protein